jgi:hypothetical protein
MMKTNTTPAYGHGTTYTPATDGCAKPFVPAADKYSPPAKNELTPAEKAWCKGETESSLVYVQQPTTK